MARIIDAGSKRRVLARLGAGVALSALLVLGTFARPAGADEHRGGDRDHHDDRGHDGGNRGYYAPPPVVYGTPYNYGYRAPPVVYGGEPGININIR